MDDREECWSVSDLFTERLSEPIVMMLLTMPVWLSQLELAEGLRQMKLALKNQDTLLLEIINFI